MNDEIKEILVLQNYVNRYKSDEKAIINHSILTTPLMLDYLEVKNLYNYITNLQQAFERSYTEEQLDFAVNEVKEQLKIEKQYSNQLCNEIDKLRVKNYELQQLEQEHKKINGELRKEIKKLTAESTEWESKYYEMQDNFHNANEEIERQSKAQVILDDMLADYKQEKEKLEIALQNIQEDYDKRIEENERLKDITYNPEETNNRWVEEESELRKVYRERDDYKSRLEKAIEYINKNKKVVAKYEAKDTRLPLDTFMWGVDNLLNILQNGSEEK